VLSDVLIIVEVLNLDMVTVNRICLVTGVTARMEIDSHLGHQWKQGAYTAVSPCVFCRGQHFNDEYDKYKELNDHKQQLQAVLAQGRCFLCLKPGHMFRDCTFTQKNGCYYCGKQRHHYWAICPQKFWTNAQLTKENVVVFSSANRVKETQTHKEEDSSGQVDSFNSTSIQTLVSTTEKVLITSNCHCSNSVK